MRLLMATGGSIHSKAAIQLGANILTGLKVDEVATVLTVIKSKDDRSRASHILTEAKNLLLGAGVAEVRTIARIGQPAREIIQEIEEAQYDCAIIGERSSHRFITRFLGSTAIYVIKQAACPVIIAKGKIRPLRRVLLCDSGARHPSVLNRFTAQLGELLTHKTDITVLHVMSQMSAGPRVHGTQLRADATELIQNSAPEGKLLVQDVQTLAGLNLQSTPKVRHGFVVDEILAEARHGNFDLVVIGDYRGEGWGRLLLENLAHQIIVKIDRPVLIVK